MPYMKFLNHTQFEKNLTVQSCFTDWESKLTSWSVNYHCDFTDTSNFAKIFLVTLVMISYIVFKLLDYSVVGDCSILVCETYIYPKKIEKYVFFVPHTLGIPKMYNTCF